MNPNFLLFVSNEEKWFSWYFFGFVKQIRSIFLQILAFLLIGCSKFSKVFAT